MSRIHEALKKAEQERAAVQSAVPPGVAPPSANETAEITPGPPDGSQPAVGDFPGGVPLTAAMPSFSGSGAFNLENLLARCSPLPWNPDQRTMLFFNGDDNARGSEEFRTLRSRLYHTREKMPLKKILVTSALPKEGKSFTAANLAQVLVRQHGRRVLLVDADLRAPRLHIMLGTSSSPGLSDYLQGVSDEISIMQRGPMESLFFIPCGAEISDPSELVANGRLPLLLQRVETLFDWIIIDSPPAVPVSDASVLAKACDGVLMVVRSNATPVDMARRARQEFPDQALVGVVLNGTENQAVPYTRYYYDNNDNNLNHDKKTTESKR
jgi:protein-tyrosine kinase